MTSKKHQFRRVGKAIVAAGRMMLKYEVPRDAAGISYFGLVALFPAIIVMIALVDAFLGWMNLHDTVLKRIADLFPGSRQFLTSNLNEIATPSTAIVISCILVVLWSSSWIYTFIESGINRAWSLSHQRTFWESRMRGIALMALGGFSLLFSAGITTFVRAVRLQAEIHISQTVQAHYFMDRFWHLILLGAGFLIAVLVFAFVFKWAPHRKVLWMEAFPGALVSTVMWEVGSFIFAAIVPFFDYQRIYGKMGAVISLLAWV
jgi:membrane protein